MADTLLSVNNLHVSYGAIKAVRGISFEIKKGEIVPNSETPENANNADWLNKAGFTNTTVEFE